MSASPGEIQNWHPLVSAIRIINVKLKKVHLQSTNLTYVQFQIVNINETENTDKDKTVSYVKYVLMTTMIYKICNTSMSTHLRPKHEITCSSGSSSGPIETTMAQMNPQITVTKTSQLRQRASETMFAKGSLSFNSARAQRILQKLL